MLANDLRDIATVALASRLCVVTLAVLSDLLLPDHQAQGALLAPFEPECTAVAPLLRAFTRWDAAHFLRVARHGWRDEWSFAFFPAFPLLLRAAGGAVRRLDLSSLLCEQEAMVLGGVILSNTCFILAACCLYLLSLEVLRERRLAHASALLFCVSPASVFFSSLYSESSYALAAFGACYALERRRPLPAALVLLLASALRANGLLNAPLVIFHTLSHALAAASAAATTAASTATTSASTAPTSAVLVSRAVGRRRAARRAAGAAAAGALLLLLVFAPYLLWMSAAYVRYCLPATRAAAYAPLLSLTTAGPAATALTPTATAAAASFIASLFGAPSSSSSSLASSSAAHLSPDWCAAPLPDLYAHVQSTYWGVGALRYYQWRQLPNFALAAPSLLLCASACLAAALGLRPAAAAATPPSVASSPTSTARAATTSTTVSSSTSLAPAPAAPPPPPQQPELRRMLRAFLRLPPEPRADHQRGGSVAVAGGEATVREARALPYLVHWALLSAFALVVSNVQVATRLMAAACPPFYWHMASLLRQPDTPRLRWLLIAYVLGYAGCGTILHANFFPWT